MLLSNRTQQRFQQALCYCQTGHNRGVNRRCVTVKQDPPEASTDAVLLLNRTHQRCQQALCYCPTGHNRGVNRRCVTVKQDTKEVSTDAVLLSNRTQQRCQSTDAMLLSNRTQQRCQRNNAEERFCPLLPGILKRIFLKVPGFARLSFYGRRIKMKMSKHHRWNDTVSGKTAVLGDKPVQVPLYLQ